jgi:hypothetical protein
MFETDELYNEEREIFIEKILEACKEVNIRKVSCEAWYQKLLEKSDRTENEEFIFKLMTRTKEMFDKTEEFYQSIHIKSSKYFDWNSLPIKAWEYHFKQGQFSNHVAIDLINNWCISTVWLGLNHNYFSDQKPLIFETMIFKDDEEMPDNEDFQNYQERYSTLEEAEEGHKRACEFVKEITKIENTNNTELSNTESSQDEQYEDHISLAKHLIKTIKNHWENLAKE